MSFCNRLLSLDLDDMPEVDAYQMDEDTVQVELRFDNAGEQLLYLNGEPELLIQLSQAIFTAVALQQERERAARIEEEAASLAEVE